MTRNGLYTPSWRWRGGLSLRFIGLVGEGRLARSEPMILGNTKKNPPLWELHAIHMYRIIDIFTYIYICNVWDPYLIFLPMILLSSGWSKNLLIIDPVTARAQVMGTSLQVSPFNTLLSLTPEHVPRLGWRANCGWSWPCWEQTTPAICVYNCM